MVGFLPFHPPDIASSVEADGLFSVIFKPDATNAKDFLFFLALKGDSGIRK